MASQAWLGRSTLLSGMLPPGSPRERASQSQLCALSSLGPLGSLRGPRGVLPSEEPTFGSPRAGWPQASEGVTGEGILQANYLSIPVIPDLPAEALPSLRSRGGPAPYPCPL